MGGVTKAFRSHTKAMAFVCRMGSHTARIPDPKGVYLCFPSRKLQTKKWALEIGLPDELLDFARMVNSGELSGRADVTVRLTADIDLTGHQWTPIGLGKAQFAGRFDGCGPHHFCCDDPKEVARQLRPVRLCNRRHSKTSPSPARSTIGPESLTPPWAGSWGTSPAAWCGTAPLTWSSTATGGPWGSLPGALWACWRRAAWCRTAAPASGWTMSWPTFLYLGGVAGGRHGLPRGALHLHRGHHRPGRRDLLHRRRGHRAGNVQGRSSVTGCLNLGVLDAQRPMISTAPLLAGSWGRSSTRPWTGRYRCATASPWAS